MMHLYIKIYMYRTPIFVYSELDLTHCSSFTRKLDNQLQHCRFKEIDSQVRFQHWTEELLTKKHLCEC